MATEEKDFLLVNAEEDRIDVLTEMDFGEKRIINLADPINEQDAATKKYVDENGGGGGSSIDIKKAMAYSFIFGAR
jgi:hypothetical protein